jgi:precorrin-4/cobalt-precorrin-4 C11-methyltransferase
MNLAASMVLSLVAILADRPAEVAHRPAALTVQIKSQPPTQFSRERLDKLPRAKIQAGKDKARRTYEGVPLAEVLHAAGITWGSKCSLWLDAYVVVEGDDEYRVVFSFPEIDPGLAYKTVLLADRCDGKPLAKALGPYQMIEQDGKQHGRWVRQVSTVSVLMAPDGCPADPKPAGATSLCRPAPSGPSRDASGGQARGKGAVYLVGMGPGDAELLTFQAAKALQAADCIFCFEYLKDEVARYAPAEKIVVASSRLMGRFRGQSGKDLPPRLRDRARQSEEEAAKFLPQVRALVASGKTVVFADSGDPTVYCPWSWVTEDFADLKPAVVPGLSSFNAASAALCQSVTKQSGSVLLSAGDDLGHPDQRGRLKTTLVLFTHRAKLAELLPRLQSRYPSDTPIAVVTEASYQRQRVIFATLGTIQKELGEKKLPHLYLVYVGDGLTPPARVDRAGGRNTNVENGKNR